MLHAQWNGLSNSWLDVCLDVNGKQDTAASLPLRLTMVFSMWSCRESISRSPTGCQVALASSAWVSRRSSWSMELCSSWSRSKARSTWLCQPPTCPFRRSHRSLTSPVCLRMARANPRAFSSGVRSGGKKKEKGKLFVDNDKVHALYYSLFIYAYFPHCCFPYYGSFGEDIFYNPCT